MRIRKRSVPLPLSSLCPVTLPDPLQLHRPPAPAREKERDASRKEEEKEAKWLHPDADGDSIVEGVKTHLNQPLLSSNRPLPPPELEENRPRSDLQLMLIRGRDGWFCSHGGDQLESKTEKEFSMPPNILSKDLQGEEKTEAKRWRGKGNNFSVRKENISEAGRWCEGEKAFPLKKRRGHFEREVSEEMIIEKEKKMRTRMRTRTTKKWVELEDDEEDKKEEEEDYNDDNEEEGINYMKKKGMGGVVIEGSRCSRVNGRGWRCCQQTLVGYSLCEHHLGKGRLRSMSTVRSRPSSATTSKNDEVGERRLKSLSSQSSSSPSWSASSWIKEEQQEQTLVDKVEEEDEEKPLMITKKRKKIGMVKARSISSLLGQTNNVTTTADMLH